MSDPQQGRVYEWEDEWAGWSLNTLTLPELRAAVRTALAKYGLPPIPVKQHRKWSLSYYIDDSHISFQAVGPRNRGGKNIATALHEAAHHICFKMFGDRVQDHGPTWLGIFMWLLEEAKVAPATALHASARARGLRWRRVTPQHPRA